MIGKSAVAGTVTAAVILLFYVIWLIRLGPAYSEMAKTAGNIAVRFVGLFFLAYVILSAAFLADLMAQVVPSSLISGYLRKIYFSSGSRQPAALAHIGECSVVEGSQKCQEEFFWQE